MNRLLVACVMIVALSACGQASVKMPPAAEQDDRKITETFFASPPPWPDKKPPAIKVQAEGALMDLRNKLALKGGSLQGCVSIKAYLRGNVLQTADFDGFLFAYSRVFGTRLIPNRPDLIQIEVSGFARPGQLVLMEARCAIPG